MQSAYGWKNTARINQAPCTSGFCSWQGFSVAAQWELTHIPMASSPPGWTAPWLSPVLVLGASPRCGVWHGRDAWSDGANPHLGVWAPAMLQARCSSFLWPLCPSQCLGSGTWRGDKSPDTRAVIYLLPQPCGAPVEPLSSAATLPFCFHLLTFF